MIPKEQICLLADTMAGWQTPYGRPDPKKCPFIYTDTFVSSMNFHSPTFMAIGLYQAYEATGEIKYKEAADRYIVGYFACLRNPHNRPDFYAQTWLRLMEDKFGPISPEQRMWANNILQWPFIQGMALAGYRWFRRYNPDELALEAKASALYEWMQYWRWDEGSYYRNGYGDLKKGTIDNANSDDCCHMGRGLMGYYEVTKRKDVLADAEALARYYLTEVDPGTFKGCWSSKAGTWVVAPTTVEGFEHLAGKKSCEVSWGFSSIGSIEFLLELAQVTENANLRMEIAEKCASSMKWHFDTCQFEDGAIGLSECDDKWLGITAGAIMTYIWTRDTGFLTDTDIKSYRPKVEAAREWMIANVTPEGIDAGGYFKVTGHSKPKPPDNQAWLFGLTLQGLCALNKL